MDLKDTTKSVIKIAREAGDFLKRERLNITDKDINVKGQGDFVSRVDHESEAFLNQKLSELIPGSVVMGEEDSPDAEGGEWRWIVDPLDGTTNYLQGIPVYAVSIALEDRQNITTGWGDIVSAVTYLPELNLCFDAWKGGGARRNGESIYISNNNKNINRSVLATGFPFHNHRILGNYLEVFRKIFVQVANVRRIGSAAADLAWVADGTFDGFWEAGLKPWDMAAGILLVREAGGEISDFWRKNPLENGWIIAGNSKVYNMLYSTIKEVFPIDNH